MKLLKITFPTYQYLKFSFVNCSAARANRNLVLKLKTPTIFGLYKIDN